MKISLPTLGGRGRKRRAALNPVLRSKSCTDKNEVNMKVLWRDHPVNYEQACLIKFVSSPDLAAQSVVQTRNANSPLTSDSMNNSQRKQQHPEIPTSLSSFRSTVREDWTTDLEQAHTQIRQSSLSLIQPSHQEVRRERTRAGPPQKSGAMKINSNESKTLSEPTRSCVETDCVVCSLARPHLRHRVVFQPEFWREFY
jgi:hypothetical protein